MNRAQSSTLRASAIPAILLILMGCTRTAPDTAAIDSTSPTSVNPVRAWNQAVVSCLQSEGWPDAEVNPDGAGYAVPSVTEAQREAFQSTNSECIEIAGPAPNLDPLTDAQIDKIYDHLVDSISCIEDLGYTPDSNAPSREVFRGQYHSGDAPWSPFLGVSSLSPAQSEELNRTCPQLPPDLYE